MRRLLVSFAILALALAISGQSTAPLPGHAGRFQDYAVAADQPLASRAGAEILAAGGNAADAAAAALLALGVTSPGSSGLGGGGFALYYRASDRSLTFLDFRERAPAAATADMFADNDTGEGAVSRKSQLGGLASGVPGEPAGILELLRRFGSKTPAEVAAPAIRHAADGFPVTPYLAGLSVPFGAQMRADPILRRWFAGDATTLTPGQQLRQPSLAATLRLFASQGAEPFYRGAIARQIVQRNRQQGGVMTAADLRDYRVVERQPISAERFGLRWVSAPPPSSGGYTMLASLALLERWIPAARRRRGGHELLHAMAESWKGPFWDRVSYIGDPDHVEVPIAAMLADERIARRSAVFYPTLAHDVADYALPLDGQAAELAQPDGAGTSHLCVVDADGNVAAVTTTINLPFGARYTAAGIVMNNEMDDFASAVGEANAYGLMGGAPNLPGPGKRPVSSMSPTIVFDGDRPTLCIGAAGGSRIITATEQVAYDVLVRGIDPVEAIDAPRIHHQGAPDHIRTENDHPLDAHTIAQLAARGHAFEEGQYGAVVQLIRLTNDGLIAVSDPRKHGAPAGH